MNRPRRRALRPSLATLEDRCLLSALTPAQVAKAYGIDNLTFTGSGTTVRGDGTGQTVAVVVAYHNPYVASGLHTFGQKFGLPGPALTVVNQAGASADGGWAGEEMLDVE